MSHRNLNLIISLTIREHFQDLIATATHNQAVDLGERTSVYLVNMLSGFCHARAFKEFSDGTNHIKPVALMYAEAVAAAQPEARNRALTRLGDFALSIGGLFSDSLNRRVVDLDYYIGMGGAAYGSLHEAMQRDPDHLSLCELFEELEAKFGLLVDVFTEISESSRLKSNTDILLTYEIWLRTGSDRARKQLMRSGIHPIEGTNSVKVH